jgi:hypothetical protein
VASPRYARRKEEPGISQVAQARTRLGVAEEFARPEGSAHGIERLDPEQVIASDS